MTIKRLIGTDADQLPRNADLGSMAFQNSEGFSVGTLQVTTGATFPLGALTTPSLTFTGDTNTGIYSPGADQISLVTNGTAKIILTSTGVTLGATSFTGDLTLNNVNLVNANRLQFSDPGPNEGLVWAGGNGWAVYESPDDLTTNTGGNLQIAIGTTTRVATFATTGLDLNGTSGAARLSFASKSTISPVTDSVATWTFDQHNSTTAIVVDPQSVFFKPDGTKVFIAYTSSIQQYSLATAWDLTSTLTVGTPYSMSLIDAATQTVFLSPDGTKMITCGNTGVVIANGSGVVNEDRAYYFTLGTAWDISTATLVSSLRFATGDAGLPAGETSPTDVTFNGDGTIMFMSGSTRDVIYQYTLSTAYNVSTATYVREIPVGTATVPPTLSTVTIADTAGNFTCASFTTGGGLVVGQPVWITGYNTGTGSITGYNPYNNTGNYVVGTNAGAKYYIIATNGSTTFQLSATLGGSAITTTAGTPVGLTLTLNAVPGVARAVAVTGLTFNTAGTRMYMSDTNIDSCFEWRLATAWDLRTADYYDKISISFANEGDTRGLFISEANNYAFTCGTGLDQIVRYRTNYQGVTVNPENEYAPILLNGNVRVKNNNLIVDGRVIVNSNSIFLGAVNTESNLTASGNLTVAGGTWSAGNVATTVLGANTTTNISFGIGLTTGTVTIGATAQTGQILIGQSTGAQTLNLATGATAISTTKAVNIGTSGVSGSITNIAIGSATAGTDTTLNATGRVAIVQPTGGIGTVSNTAGGTTVTGVGTLFTRTFQVGDSITIGGQTVAISAIASDTSMTTASITNANTTVAYTITGGTRHIFNGSGTAQHTGSLIIGTATTLTPNQDMLSIRTTNAGASVIAKVANPSTTAGTAARWDLATGTANSYGILALTEAASPYMELSNGAGVTGGIYLTSGTTSAPIILRQAATERMRIDSSGNMTVATGNIGITAGNLTFGGTSQRITGDFSNATAASRLMFQTSTTNGVTSVEVLPNGTATQSQYNVTNNADPNNTSLGQLSAFSADVRISSTARGTGTTLPMTFYTAGVERMRIDTTGNVSISGNLTINGTTTTVNSSTTTVDDKNLELGSVTSATVSTTGTVGSITGTGPWTATITGMSSTTGLVVGSAIAATAGTGTLYGGSPTSVLVTSIVSSTSITYTVTGGTIPTAGTVTNITTTGATDFTADGGGVTILGTTNKTWNWVASTDAWTSSENIDVASGMVYKINGTTVLSATALDTVTVDGGTY